MNAPDQPPLKIGEFYYLKRVSVYRRCRLLSLRAPDDFEHTAKVIYCTNNEPLICRQSELLNEDQYQEVMTRRRKEAYARDLPLRREQAKAKYAEVVAHWNTGRRTAKEMAETSKVGTARSWGQMIAAAKRWKLIVDDKPSVN